jgi:hypothetical protein
MKRIALTPALSRLTGEGETFPVPVVNLRRNLMGGRLLNQKMANGCLRSLPVEVGQGEEKLETKKLKTYEKSLC